MVMKPTKTKTDSHYLAVVLFATETELKPYANGTREECVDYCELRIPKAHMERTRYGVQHVKSIVWVYPDHSKRIETTYEPPEWIGYGEPPK